jgi:transcriptional regulator with XRE-family HTH domain
MTLAKRIRDSRYAKGWGPDELASRAKISRTALYQIESGKTEAPRAATLRRIARALGVSTDALLGNEPLGFGIVGVADGDSPSGREWEGEAEPATALAASEANLPPRFNPWMTVIRTREVERKLHALLDSPLGEGVARIIEESYRLLPGAQGRAMS